MIATYAKLQDGSWGIRADFPINPGDLVTVTKRSGDTNKEYVGEIRGTQNEFTIATIAHPVVPGQVEDEGVYVLGSGMDQIVKVKRSKQSGKLYAMILRETGGQRLTEVGETVNFEWEYAPGLIRDVRGDQKMTLEQAKAFGIRYGTCMKCGRHLKAAESVEKAIGPVCGKWFKAA